MYWDGAFPSCEGRWLGGEGEEGAALVYDEKEDATSYDIINIRVDTFSAGICSSENRRRRNSTLFFIARRQSTRTRSAAIDSENIFIKWRARARRDEI